MRVLSAGTIPNFFSELEKELQRDAEEYARKSCSRCGNETAKIRDLCEFCSKVELRRSYNEIY